MKIKKSNKRITAFGGAIPVLKYIRDFGIAETISECLGKRPTHAKYGYDDVLISWMLTNLCGGFRLDHISKLRKNLDIIPGLKLPSHDTLGRVMKSLATDVLSETEVHRGKNSYREAQELGSKTYKRLTTRTTNDNDKMNKLLVALTKQVGLIEEGRKYDIDLDVTTIYSKVLEAKKDYKRRKTAFSPMVACIDKLPIYIEMRGGNVAPNARILESVKKCVENLKENKVGIGKIRMDAGGFNGNTFDYLNDEGIQFVVGARTSKKMKDIIGQDNNWNNCVINTSKFKWECETKEFMYSVNNSKEYRCIALRIDIRKEGATGESYSKTPMTWRYGGKWAYKVIITNDMESSVEDLFWFYNQRGTSEQNFDILKNDFSWRIPPFSRMNENSVFLIIGAITNNIYNALIKLINKKTKKVRTNGRLRDFIYQFISVGCIIENDAYVFDCDYIDYRKFC